MTSPVRITARIARLFVYPVKSCAGVELPEALLTETGLEFDRAWMVVDDAAANSSASASCRAWRWSGRSCKHMRDGAARARHAGAAHRVRPRRGADARARVGRRGRGLRHGRRRGAVVQRFPRPSAKLRLVRFDPEQRRLSSLQWTGGVEAPTSSPTAIRCWWLSEASMAELNAPAGRGRAWRGGHRALSAQHRAGGHRGARRRPHRHAAHDTRGGREARCSRSSPARAARFPTSTRPRPSRPEVGDTLRGYRADPRVDGAITFGMNAIVREGVEHMLQVGAAGRRRTGAFE